MKLKLALVALATVTVLVYIYRWDMVVMFSDRFIGPGVRPVMVNHQKDPASQPSGPQRYSVEAIRAAKKKDPIKPDASPKPDPVSHQRGHACYELLVLRKKSKVTIEIVGADGKPALIILTEANCRFESQTQEHLRSR